MTIVEEAQNLLDTAGISGIDDTYTYNIPYSESPDTKVTQVLITDNGSSAESYGNDDFHAFTGEIELQIWYAAVDGIDYDATEMAILKAFTAQHWQVSGWRRRVTDPDTKQLSNTTYIRKTQNLRGN
ncbi:DUF806 family protein [Lacticaseibacillus daqingensis]|uniref:DUF806 family protein n=1 Tax=Lacticaseibacillus daqingensis TaxID=2486014 RepID=UPI000F775A5C|nr:DUF806 family protein [Lacticaseibacillus daqingensis]